MHTQISFLSCVLTDWWSIRNSWWEDLILCFIFFHSDWWPLVSANRLCSFQVPVRLPLSSIKGLWKWRYLRCECFSLVPVFEPQLCLLCISPEVSLNKVHVPETPHLWNRGHKLIMPCTASTLFLGTIFLYFELNIFNTFLNTVKCCRVMQLSSAGARWLTLLECWTARTVAVLHSTPCSPALKWVTK